VVLCLWQWTVELRDGVYYVNYIAQKRILADYLRERLKATSNLKVLCDDDTIKVLAGIPSDSCFRSSGLPIDSKAFLDYLRENRVEFVVYERRNGSAPEKVFRDLGEDDVTDHFQVVASTGTDLRLYRTVF
jgi:hypothetical protein